MCVIWIKSNVASLVVTFQRLLNITSDQEPRPLLLLKLEQPWDDFSIYLGNIFSASLLGVVNFASGEVRFSGHCWGHFDLNLGINTNYICDFCVMWLFIHAQFQRPFSYTAMGLGAWVGDHIVSIIIDVITYPLADVSSHCGGDPRHQTKSKIHNVLNKHTKNKCWF